MKITARDYYLWFILAIKIPAENVSGIGVSRSFPENKIAPILIENQFFDNGIPVICN